MDAIWINANPYSGPATTYAEATRRDELVACLDPIAIDIWSVKNILIPGFIANGYSPPWPPPSADPDMPSGTFRTYLDNSMNHLLAAGIDVTNDYGQIDILQGNGAVPGPVRLAIFDSGGRLVRTLADGTKDAGAFSVHWDGRNDRGERVGPGVYWYRLEAPGHRGAKSVVVLGRP